MEKWEYQTIAMVYDGETSQWTARGVGESIPIGNNLGEALNRWGEQGWEAVGYDGRHDSIEGFANFHEFQIGGVVLMPATGKLVTVPGPLDRSQAGYRSRFDKSQLHLSGTKPCPY